MEALGHGHMGAEVSVTYELDGRRYRFTFPSTFYACAPMKTFNSFCERKADEGFHR